MPLLGPIIQNRMMESLVWSVHHSIRVDDICRIVLVCGNGWVHCVHSRLCHHKLSDSVAISWFQLQVKETGRVVIHNKRSKDGKLHTLQAA